MFNRNIAIASALISALLVAGDSAGQVATGFAAEMERLDHAMQRAFVTRDQKFLRDLLTDDYVLITSSSKLVSKEQVLAELVDPKEILEVNDSSEIQVRRHGDTAVITALLHQRGSSAGEPFDAWVRYTDTWVLEGGRWRYMSAHASRMPPPATTSNAR
jgi:ketosteroid isomerase-like protein